MLLRATIRAARGGAGVAKPTSVVCSINSANAPGSVELRTEVRALASAILRGHKSSTVGTTATVSTWYEKPMAKPANFQTDTIDISNIVGQIAFTADANGPTDYMPSHVGLLLAHAAPGGRPGKSHLRGALQEIDVKTGAAGAPTLATGINAQPWGDVNAFWDQFHIANPTLLVVANIRKGQNAPTIRDVTQTRVIGVFQRKDTRHKRPELLFDSGKTEPEGFVENMAKIAEDLAPAITWALARKVGLTALQRVPVVGAVSAIIAVGNTIRDILGPVDPIPPQLP